MAPSQATHEELLQQLVLRNRDDPSPKLPVDWALLRLLDSSHCTQLAADLEVSCPGGWEVFQATESLDQLLPDTPGLYMFVWRPWMVFRMDAGVQERMLQVLYIGLAGAKRHAIDANTSTIRSRYKSYRKHLRAEPKTLWSPFEPHGRDQTLNRYLTLRPLEYWFLAVEDPSVLESLERRLIATLNPPCNDREKPLIMTMVGPEQPAVG